MRIWAARGRNTPRNTPRQHEDEAGFEVDDNEAHAPGMVCVHCGAVITAGQDVRRRADGQWVHEFCPVV